MSVPGRWTSAPPQGSRRRSRIRREPGSRPQALRPARQGAPRARARGLRSHGSPAASSCSTSGGPRARRAGLPHRPPTRGRSEARSAETGPDRPPTLRPHWRRRTSWCAPPAPPRRSRSMPTTSARDHCGDGASELTPLDWSRRFVAPGIAASLDYVPLSYYPAQCGGAQPTPAKLTRYLASLHSFYPRAGLGFGEVGLYSGKSDNSGEPGARSVRRLCERVRDMARVGEAEARVVLDPGGGQTEVLAGSGVGDQEAALGIAFEGPVTRVYEVAKPDAGSRPRRSRPGRRLIWMHREIALGGVR